MEKSGEPSNIYVCEKSAKNNENFSGVLVVFLVNFIIFPIKCCEHKMGGDGVGMSSW